MEFLWYWDGPARPHDFECLPVGQHWWIATHKEDISEEELKRRAAVGHA